MARTTRGRRSQRHPTAAGNGSAANLLLSQVTELVAENQSLVRENKALHSILARVSQAVEGIAARPAAGRTGADGGRAQGAADAEAPPHHRPGITRTAPRRSRQGPSGPC